MKEKPTITYIKKGIEKKEDLTFSNYRKVLKELYKITFKSTGNLKETIYTINDNIEFIHFKNFVFPEINKLRCSKNTLCILENCTFKNKKHDFQILCFEGGVYEVINSNFINIESIYIAYHNIKEFIIKHIEENKKDLLKRLLLNLGSKGQVSYSNNKMNLNNIEDNEKINNSVKVKDKKINLNGNFSILELELKEDKMAINNTKRETSIKVNCSNQSNREVKKLELTNCLLEGKEINISSLELEVENIKLKAQNRICINDNIFYKKELDNEVIVTDKDINRTNLINILKGYKKLLEQQFEIKENKSIKKLALKK